MAMDVTATQNPYCFCCQQPCAVYTLKRCCLFLGIIILFTMIAVGIAALPVIFLLKPQQPIFSLQSVTLDWYNISVKSGSPLLSSVFTLTLNAQNPNKIAIKYSPSKLLVIYDDGNVMMGTIRVPGIFQPAHCNDQSVRTRLLLHRFNIVDLIDAMPLPSLVDMKILGDVGIELFVFHVALVKMKVALNCDVNVDYRELNLNLRNEVYSADIVDKILDSFPSNSQTISTKCAISFYI